MYGCERTGCEVKALRRSLPDEALSRAQALAENSTSRSLCRTGAMPPWLGGKELRRPLATGPMQKRIHGLS